MGFALINIIQYADYCQPAVSKIDVYVTVFLNVATDMYLISIPTPVHTPPSMVNKSNIYTNRQEYIYIYIDAL